MKKDVTGQSNGLLTTDRSLLGGLFGFYLICICATLGFLGWWLARRETTANANATATAVEATAQSADATETAGLLATQQATYEFVEEFERNAGRWYVGRYDITNGDLAVSIRNGHYIWEFIDSKGLTQSTEFFKEHNIQNFDSYMDLKVAENPENGIACSGFFFRKQEIDWEAGAYIFLICNRGRYVVYYLDQAGWEVIQYSEYHSAIRLDDWNRVAVSARNDIFKFFVNNVEVYEMTDDRLEAGRLGIFFEVEKNKPIEIWVDNFGYQSR